MKITAPRIFYSLGPLLLVATSNADLVTDWNSAALNVIRIEKTPPPAAARALAILHVAIYDAVNGIRRTHNPFLVGGLVPRTASVEAAASAAARKVLVSLFTSEQDAFNAQYQTALLALPNMPQTRAGIAWGEIVAAEVLAARAADGLDAIVPLPSFTGPGVWVPTPPRFAPYLLPQWGFLQPFCMTSSSEFRPPGPPALTSARYAADVNEVK